MRDERLRELAILGLEAERQRIDDELAALRSRGTAWMISPPEILGPEAGLVTTGSFPSGIRPRLW